MWLGMASAAAAQVPGLPDRAARTRPIRLLLAYIAQVAAWCGRPELGRGRRLARRRRSGCCLPGARRGRRACLPAGSTPAPGSGATRRPRSGAGSSRRSGEGGPPRGRGAGRARAAGGDRGAGRRPRGRVAAGSARRGPRCRPGRRDPAPAGRMARRCSSTAGPPARGSRTNSRRPASSASRWPSSPTIRPTTRRDRGAARPPPDRPVGLWPTGTSVAGGGQERPARRRRRSPPAPDCVPAGYVSMSSGLPPPAGGACGRETIPTSSALVLLARWRDFSMLLSADAEAEAVPLDPGPVDVLKVAHHGSEDAGLGPLLDRARPALAVISVGAANPYGHPTAAALSDVGRARRPHLQDRSGRRRRHRRTAALDRGARGGVTALNG